MKIINLGNLFINNYLYKNKYGYVLIDTGYEGRFEAFIRKLKINIDDIKFLFITHAHDDPVGFLKKFIAENKTATIVASNKSIETLMRGQNSVDGGCTTKLALRFYKMMKLFSKNKHCFHALNDEDINRGYCYK